MHEIEKTAKLIADELGFEVKKIGFKRDYGRKILSVTIDKAGGITIRDCEIFSKKLGLILDEADIIKEKYYLEVSSPGI